ncbi:MAG: restriction endonuclease subunit S, partial [Synergistaceae bacterium]|nr:restriction endonuclease subunit S [Synergistaceae bacterium]
MKLAEDLRRAVLQAAIEGNLTGGSQENWRFVRLGDISSYGEPVAKVSVKNIPANSWLLDLEDIEKGGRVVRTRTAQESKSTGDKAIFHQGDILYSKLRPYLQKVLIAPSDGYCTPELIPFHCHGDIEPQYIVYFLKAPSVDYEITSKSYGVKMPRVGTNTMKNLLVPLPPIDEQRRIVSRLNAILPKIAELEAAENELEALESKFPGDMRNSLLQAAIEGKLTGGKREGWQWVRLGDVGTFVRGHGIKKSDTTETGKPCIRYGQLYTTFKT